MTQHHSIATMAPRATPPAIQSHRETRSMAVMIDKLNKSRNKVFKWMNEAEMWHRKRLAIEYDTNFSKIGKSKKEGFRIFDLPQELRDEIYKFALVVDEELGVKVNQRIDIRYNKAPNFPHVKLYAKQTLSGERWNDGEPAIARASYQLRYETLPIWYGTKTVVIHLETPFHIFKMADPGEITPARPNFDPVLTLEKLALACSIELAQKRFRFQHFSFTTGRVTVRDPDSGRTEFRSPSRLELKGLHETLRMIQATGLPWDNLILRLSSAVSHLVKFEHPDLGFDRKAATEDRHASPQNLKRPHTKLRLVDSAKSITEDPKRPFISVQFLDEIREYMRKMLKGCKQGGQNRKIASVEGLKVALLRRDGKRRV